jgi:hypothetical protein
MPRKGLDLPEERVGMGKKKPPVRGGFEFIFL